jgi:protein-disulfide isomerase
MPNCSIRQPLSQTARRASLVAALLCAAVTLLAPPAEARGIRWSRVINANPSALSAADRARAKRLMNTITVYYGCSDTVANCLVMDKSCETSRRIAGLIVRMVGQGRSDSWIKDQVKKRGLSAHPFKRHRFNLTRRPRFGAPAGRAKVTIVEFADFECPFCRVISPKIKKLVRELASRGVSLVYKHYPVSFHRQAIPASRAAYAAHQQGRFWPYHDLLYQKAPRLSVSQLESYAGSVGLNVAQFRSVRDSRRSRLVLAADKREGLKAGVKGTPTFYINGKMYQARKDYTELKDRVEEELNLVAGGR